MVDISPLSPVHPIRPARPADPDSQQPKRDKQHRPTRTPPEREPGGDDNDPPQIDEYV